MKARESYRLTAVRLVEFHNLGTTTVDLPDGGHLFLLGDNGSGKTTLLDAIHLVLSGGREMEFNSAARVAGAKDSGGRTIQGIVLRYNAVTGRAAREAGITYAAVELKSDMDKTLSLVVGLSAEGLDVAYQSWGGVAAAAVRDLPLTVEENGRLRAATQAEFKRAVAELAGGKYFVHIGDYRETVANRLFGGEAKYADVCKLLRTGKAYREIAARAANYDDLFRQLLEDPPRETFEPLLKGLRELEESKGRLDLIDARGNYLSRLKGLRDKLGTLRLKTSAIAWAEADDVRLRAEREVADLSASCAAGAEELKSLETAWNLARAETDRARERYDALRQKDASGLLGREKSSSARFAEAKRRAEEESQRLAEEESSVRTAGKVLASAEKARNDSLGKASEALRKSAHAAGVSIGALTDALAGRAARPESAPYRDVSAVAGRPPYHAAESVCERAFVAVGEEMSSAQERAVKTAVSLRTSAESAATAVDAARAAVDALAKNGEAMPDVLGFASAKDSLKAEMLSARAVYELLEPASGCDARHLALLERFAGEEFLATFVADEKDADRVRRIAWRSAEATAPSCLAVAVRENCAGTDVTALTPWLGNYISFENSDVAAVQLLARHLAASGAPADGDFLEAKTWSFRSREGLLPQSRPRLVGVKARKQEQARLRREAEVKLDACEREMKRLEKSAAEAETKLTLVKSLAGEVEAARTSVWRTEESVRSAQATLTSAESACARTRQLTDERKREAELLREELEDIRLQMRSEGIDATLEKRLASAERTVRAKAEEADALLQRIGGVRGRIAGLEKAKEAREAEAAESKARVSALAGEFAAAKNEGEDDATFVARMCPDSAVGGDLRAPRPFAVLREKVVGDARVCETEIARLVREPQGEAFSFVFDVEMNVLRDRRGTSLDDVLADELRRLEELRGAINQKSREVFERIFMGEVMRRLYIDLKQIEDLVGRIQRKLSGRRFGSNRYAFALVPVPEYEGFVNLVRKGYLLESGSEKDELRDYLEAHRDEILSSEIDAVPEIFDYRRWFRFQLKVLTENEEGRVIDRRVKSLGSGGEQAVPNYLLILTVAEFLYHGGESVDPPKAAPLLFDEAFYGIDAARRDQLLAFADDLGLQLFVSSPDQDGVKREIRHSVSLIVVKDENLDVHLSPIVWTNVATQSDLFGTGGGAEPGMKVLDETR